MRHYNLTQSSHDDDEGTAKVNSWAELLMEENIPIEMLDQCLKHVIKNRNGERFPVVISEILHAHAELTEYRTDLSKLWQCRFCEWYKEHAAHGARPCPFHQDISVTETTQ